MVEQQCVRFYGETMGRPSLATGRYFRERGIAWRAADSLALRSFLQMTAATLKLAMDTFVEGKSCFSNYQKFAQEVEPHTNAVQQLPSAEVETSTRVNPVSI